MTEGKAEHKQHKKQPTARRHVGALMVVPSPPRSPSHIFSSGRRVGVGNYMLSRNLGDQGRV